MSSFIKANPFFIMEEGTKLFFGMDDVIFKNIEITLKFKEIIANSFGPDGLNKLILNDHGKIFITSNTVDILKNLNFSHPILKLLLFFCTNQETDQGDSSGFLIIFGAELLKIASELLQDGFHISDVINSFDEARGLFLKILENLANFKLVNLYNLKAIASILSLTMGSVSQEIGNFLAPQIAYSCIKTLSSNRKNFSTDDIRVVKVLGGTFDQIKTISGSIILRDTEGSIKTIKKANIVIFMNSFDTSMPETKSSILFKSAEEIMAYKSGENFLIEQTVKEIYDCGINCIIASGFSDLALFFIEKYKIMALKIQSKFDLRRIAKTSGGIVLEKIRKPTIDEIGKCDLISVRSFGSQKVTLFQQETLQTKIFTIIVRAGSTNILDYLEKIIYRSISVFKIIVRDNRFISGGGSAEIELYRRIKSLSFHEFSKVKKFIIQKLASAFEIIPRVLIENSGHDVHKILSLLHIEHSKGNEWVGVNINFPATLNTKFHGIWDSFVSKYYAIKNAFDSSMIILTVDHLIMARKTS
jgi:T-complex protein 1 subunit theta